MNTIIGVLVTFGLAIFTYLPADAQPSTDSSLHFDAAHIIGSGSSIIVHRVPVRNMNTNETTLYNVTLELSVTDTGLFTVTHLSSVESPSQQHSADHFIPGNYTDDAGNCYIVSSGGITADGRNVGSVRSDANEYTFNASWMSGPIKGHPLVGNAEVAMALLDGPSYGTVGASSNRGFCRGHLIAAAQTGESVTITAFHTNPPSGIACGLSEDTSSGQANLTLTLVANDSECNASGTP